MTSQDPQEPVDPLLAEIEARFVALVRRAHGGDDVPPGMSLRLEGLLEAAVIAGAVDEQTLDERLDGLLRTETGSGFDDRLGTNWREFMPFPALPLFMNRAPVSPSTAD